MGRPAPSGRPAVNGPAHVIVMMPALDGVHPPVQPRPAASAAARPAVAAPVGPDGALAESAGSAGRLYSHNPPASLR